MNGKNIKENVKSPNRNVAESIVSSKSALGLVETIEYYLNELDRLENKGVNKYGRIRR